MQTRKTMEFVLEFPPPHCTNVTKSQRNPNFSLPFVSSWLGSRLPHLVQREKGLGVPGGAGAVPELGALWGVPAARGSLGCPRGLFGVSPRLGQACGARAVSSIYCPSGAAAWEN